MLSRPQALAAIDVGVRQCGDVYVNEGVDEASYLASLEQDLRANLCEPFVVSAIVRKPAFPFASDGDVISGYCVAHARGYWLVFQPDSQRFLCFWGESAANLGAHGVFGSPLYCWSA